jgi:benzoylformate decarboxylase
VSEPATLRALVAGYLDRRLSRRAFVRSLGGAGVTAAAATSILESLAPLARAVAAGADSPASSVEGTGGELLVEQLRAAGVRYLFNCNTTATHAIFDALVDRPAPQVIQVPQESQMVAMAQGHALASGTVAVAVTGSVGFPGTLGNLFNAWKDGSPIVVLSQLESVGLRRGREFGEWDGYLAPSASLTRGRRSVTSAHLVAEEIRHALRVAATAPAGPVALAFSPRALSAGRVSAAVMDHDAFMIAPPIKPEPRRVEAAAHLLLAARSPLLVVGPEVTRSGGHGEVVALAERLAIPVMQGERLCDDFPTNHPLFLGDYGSHQLRGVDLILKLGSGLPAPAGLTVVHASLDPRTGGTVAPPGVDIVADVKEAAGHLLAAVEAAAPGPRLDAIRAGREAGVAAYAAAMRARRARARETWWNDDPPSWERVGAELERVLDRDAIVVPELANDTWRGLGENTALTQLTFGPGEKRKIGPTTGTALGWGVGAAIGVKLARPDRQVVALQGDGGFMFGQAESLWTMARYDVPVITVIFNNRSYNTPRNGILRRGGRQAVTGRDMTCYLGDPDVDFAKVADGFGVRGEVVRVPDEIAPALGRAIAATREGRPYLLDVAIGRTGLGAASTWHPKFSLAAARTRKV